MLPAPGCQPSTRIAAETFWEYVAFALNSIVFLLIGFEVRLRDAARLVAADPGGVPRGDDRRAPSWSSASRAARRDRAERAGERGAPCSPGAGCAGACRWCWCSLPRQLSAPRARRHDDLRRRAPLDPHPGPDHGAAAARLGIVEDAARTEYETKRGTLQAADAALTELEVMARGRAAPRDVLDTVRDEYEARIRDAEAGLQDTRLARHELRAEELKRTRRHLLQVEKNRVIDGFRRGTLSQESYEQLLVDIDARLLKLESGEDDTPGAGRDDERRRDGQ